MGGLILHAARLDVSRVRVTGLVTKAFAEETIMTAMAVVLQIESIVDLRCE